MKSISFLAALLSFCTLSAQEKGASPLSPSHPLSPAVTRALVVGISNYEDDRIPDLRYADRDAMEFVAFLKSKSGGSLQDGQIRILTNEAAKAGQIYSALDWIQEASQTGDQAIIYFSGHGDVETKTMRQRGFLLAHDTPPTNYRIGALRLEDLNDILETLVQTKKARIILITDACRSGKLAGGREGVAATASALLAQFQNEVKIMSCQASELSIEGEQWGGGRGAFSYHLLDGLTGMADLNQDTVVTLFEIDRYLSEKVPAETDQKQFPGTTGEKGARLFAVDKNELALLREKRSGLPAQMSAIAAKGLEEQVLAKADTSLQRMYQDFLTAVGHLYFLPADQATSRLPGKSASELYDVLSKEPSLEPLHHLMKRNFAAALQDESQRSLNAYLRADPAELAARWNGDNGRYKNNPLYLAKAASLLGEPHILYGQLLAKQYYFEALIKRLEGEKNGVDSLFEQALALVNKALEYDHEAAYIYNETGLIYDAIRKAGKQEIQGAMFNKQIEYYQKAMEIAPKWVMPVYNAAKTYREWRRLKEAEEMGLKTIALDSNFVDAYDDLNYVFYFSKQYQKAIEINKGLMKFRPTDSDLYFNIACLESLANRPLEAIPWLEKAIQYGHEMKNIQTDSDLDNVRITKEFDLLMKQHFSNKKE